MTTHPLLEQHTWERKSAEYIGRELLFTVVCGAESFSLEVSLWNRTSSSRSYSHFRSSRKITPEGTDVSSQSYVQEVKLRYHGSRSACE